MFPIPTPTPLDLLLMRIQSLQESLQAMHPDTLIEIEVTSAPPAPTYCLQAMLAESAKMNRYRVRIHAGKKKRTCVVWATSASEARKHPMVVRLTGRFSACTLFIVEFPENHP